MMNQMIKIKRNLLSAAFLFLLSINLYAENGYDLNVRTEAAFNTLIVEISSQAELFSQDSNAFFNHLDTAFGNLFDFSIIARRVMGRYYRSSNQKQRDQFEIMFKKGLFDTFGQFFMQIDVLSGLKDTIQFEIGDWEYRNDKRTIVSQKAFLLFKKNNKRYEVVFSASRNSENVWIFENIIISGFNLGLNFRNQFYQRMQAQRDLDEVIANWTKLPFEEMAASNNSNQSDKKN